MEYYNTYNTGYRDAINQFNNKYKIKLELMSYYENVIGDITKDIAVDVQGQININYQPITRRSCSFSMINIDNKYIPSPNNTFWFERKFKLWIGVVDKNGDTHWWAQGVFYTQSANYDGSAVNIEAVDKGAALDGSLGMNQAGAQVVVNVGSSVDEAIKNTLMLNMQYDSEFNPDIYYGGDKPLDPVMPLVDRKYRDVKIRSKISIDANNYVGDIFTALADGYGADIYYDINGHLQFAELTDGYRVDGYRYMAHQWEFNNQNAFFGNGNFQYLFEGKNCVTVFTNATDVGEEGNISYTAFNYNPMSPLRVGLVGVRRMEDTEIRYVDVDRDEMLDRCQQYAECLLIRESIKGMTVTFECPIIPHLDVNRTIGITDKANNFENETFIIQSITMPLGAGNMSISATSINWLPNKFNMEGVG